MTISKQSICTFFLLLFLSATVSAQDYKDGPKMPSNYLDEDVAVDADQTKAWRKGDYKYPSKPKDMWELGLHVGHFFIGGDVQPEFGYAFGGHLRKSLGYTFSLRFNAMYGVAKGLNSNANQVGAWNNKALDQMYGRSEENRADPTNPSTINQKTGLPWHANHKTNYMEISTQGVMSLGNLLFHKERNTWDLFLFGGVGLNAYRTYLNAEGANNQPYDFNGVRNGIDADGWDGRQEIKGNIREILDDSYESPGERWGELFNIGAGEDELAEDDYVAKPVVNIGVAVGYHLSERVTLELGTQTSFSDDDLLDGYRWSEQGDLTRDTDIPQYTNLRVNIHLGSLKNKVEPLWWLNPLTAPYDDIAQLKKRPVLDLDDDDADGVINDLDKEPNTPADCPVDTRGVQLDSDNDKVADCKDKEPYSPPGYPVDGDGVAQIPDYTTPDDVNDAIGRAIDDVKKTIPTPAEIRRQAGSSTSSACSGDWFLPMIHFDLDKYRIKPEFYSELHHVATVMAKCPNLRIVAKGHTDVRRPNQYNQVLSYNRANAAIEYLVTNYNIPRDRFILQYGGEESPLVPNLPDNHAHSKDVEKKQYMNRRVEFIVSTGIEQSMGRPNGPNAGNNSAGSSRGGTKYSGNSGSGY